MKDGRGRGSGYEVGHGRPPKQNQFVKGRSGNPKGRPRKTPSASTFGEPEAEDQFLAEAYREVTFTENGKQVTMPAFQAVMRAQILAALKGSTHAQKSHSQTLLSIEAARRTDKADLLNQALSLKIDLEHARALWIGKGWDEQAMPMHPSDVVIDALTGEVTVFAAITKEQQENQQKIIALRNKAEADLERNRAAVAEDGDDAFLEIGRELAMAKIEFFDARLPPRLRNKSRPSGRDFTSDIE